MPLAWGSPRPGVLGRWRWWHDRVEPQPDPVADVKPQFLCYDNYMVEYSRDLQDAKKAALYFTNLLEVRRVAQKHGLPFWNVVCCNRIRPHTTVPSPANLALQAYTSLAAGARGITWFKYYQGGYAYAPIDNSGRATETWHYLQLVNRQIKTLGPIMNRLTSTGRDRIVDDKSATSGISRASGTNGNSTP